MIPDEAITRVVVLVEGGVSVAAATTQERVARSAFDSRVASSPGLRSRLDAALAARAGTPPPQALPLAPAPPAVPARPPVEAVSTPGGRRMSYVDRDGRR
ncbi:hypothetical protein B4N89_46185 [Embleya scabrispora]|uniref:Uncharacterized protein n=1 Tax=Embleya scabrispora TaxID=159449 RepID=A0A1T3NJ94_9ACTN|nr:hypothetical protein B4N89_46185 [Embleya scabrispora]